VIQETDSLREKTKETKKRGLTALSAGEHSAEAEGGQGQSPGGWLGHYVCIELEDISGAGWIDERAIVAAVLSVGETGSIAWGKQGRSVLLHFGLEPKSRAAEKSGRDILIVNDIIHGPIGSRGGIVYDELPGGSVDRSPK